MATIDLLTRLGEPVTTVQVSDMAISAEVVMWGQRIFVRNDAGEYREGLLVMAQAVAMPSGVHHGRSEDGF